MGWRQPLHLPELLPNSLLGLAGAPGNTRGCGKNRGLPPGEPVGARMSPVVTGRKLEGKRAIITGSSRGLGAVIAEAMWQAGANLLLIARSEESLRELQNRLSTSRTGTQRVQVFRADLRDPAAPRA